MNGPAQPKTLGQVVLTLRHAYGIRRNELDREAGLPFGTVKRIEQGRLFPTWPTLDKLCAHPSMRRLIGTCVHEGVELGMRSPPKPET